MLGLNLTPSSAKPSPTGPYAPSSRLRGEVKPPSLRCEPHSGWHRMMFWMLAPSPLDAAPPIRQLPAVRKDFLACLEDTTGDEACALSLRIERARSLRELWHLRTALFGFLARHLSQSEAQRRVQRLSRHFGAGHGRGAARLG